LFLRLGEAAAARGLRLVVEAGPGPPSSLETVGGVVVVVL
jgi:hypothetical protein